MRERRWYSRFGIQPPFPWVGAVIICAPLLGGIGAVAAVYVALMYGGDRLVAL
jgi:hypothetical protein